MQRTFINTQLFESSRCHKDTHTAHLTLFRFHIPTSNNEHCEFNISTKFALKTTKYLIGCMIISFFPFLLLNERGRERGGFALGELDNDTG